MSKIITLSNTNLNISKGLSQKEWQTIIIDYYKNEFIPYLTNNTSSNDILIHLGNFLHNSKTIDLNTLKTIQNLFEKISNILPVYIIEGKNDNLPLNILKNFKNINIIKEPTEIEVLLDQKILMLPNSTKLDDIDKFESDYCFFNLDFLNSNKKDLFVSKFKKFKKCYNGFYNKNGVKSNIKNLGSPYNIDDDVKKGFIVLKIHEDKDMFVLNKKSPKFKKINIETVEDLNIDKELLKNNNISLRVNQHVLIDNKLKFDMLVSEHNIRSITYTNDEIVKNREDVLELDNTSLTLNEMITDYINKSGSKNKDEVLKEFETIVNINKK